MDIENFLVEILDEYDGFKYKSTLTFEEAKLKMAAYAVACAHDSKLLDEAMKICGKRKVILITEGTVRKGGLNPPNTSNLRPPAPKGSGRKST
jgi:hypothetical protein